MNIFFNRNLNRNNLLILKQNILKIKLCLFYKSRNFIYIYKRELLFFLIIFYYNLKKMNKCIIAYIIIK